MIILELDDREAWVLTQMLEVCLVNEDSFITTDENDEETHDQDLRDETVVLFNQLLKIRGLG
jgi:hypothetical protein